MGNKFEQAYVNGNATLDQKYEKELWEAAKNEAKAHYNQRESVSGARYLDLPNWPRNHDGYFAIDPVDENGMDAEQVFYFDWYDQDNCRINVTYMAPVQIPKKSYAEGHAIVRLNTDYLDAEGINRILMFPKELTYGLLSFLEEVERPGLRISFDFNLPSGQVSNPDWNLEIITNQKQFSLEDVENTLQLPQEQRDARLVESLDIGQALFLAKIPEHKRAKYLNRIHSGKFVSKSDSPGSLVVREIIAAANIQATNLCLQAIEQAHISGTEAPLFIFTNYLNQSNIDLLKQTRTDIPQESWDTMRPNSRVMSLINFGTNADTGTDCDNGIVKMSSPARDYLCYLNIRSAIAWLLQQPNPYTVPHINRAVTSVNEDKFLQLEKSALINIIKKQFGRIAAHNRERVIPENLKKYELSELQTLHDELEAEMSALAD